MSDLRVLRWEIPIDELDHPLPIVGPVLAVAGHRMFLDRVELWGLGVLDLDRLDLGQPAPPRLFRVFGTGHAIPAGYEWAGTAARTEQGYVWHCFEHVGPEPADA